MRTTTSRINELENRMDTMEGKLDSIIALLQGNNAKSTKGTASAKKTKSSKQVSAGKEKEFKSYSSYKSARNAYVWAKLGIDPKHPTWVSSEDYKKAAKGFEKEHGVWVAGKGIQK